MAPLVLELKKSAQISVDVAVTAQHRQMLDQVLEVFSIEPDYDLDVMRPGQSLNQLLTRVVSGLDSVMDRARPDLVLVHGDTTTTLGAARAAHYRKVDIGHVEAGLRTGDLLSPWPEEANRKLTAAISAFHFAPTSSAKGNLISEGVEESRIWVTGNTVIDALFEAQALLKSREALKNIFDKNLNLDPKKKLIVVTGHRRESFGVGFENICKAMRKIALHYADVQIVYPVHFNPSVQGPVFKNLSGVENISLIEPLDYLPFVNLMQQAHLILTDSGGVQDEAPSLGYPVLVMRVNTERPEAVEAGTVKLVGTSQDAIFSEVVNLLENQSDYRSMSLASNPYGDGLASRRIRDIIEQRYGVRRVQEEKDA